jgi:hypothetical protein
MRDNQRGVAYAAEDGVFDGTFLNEEPGGERIEQIARQTLDWLGFRDTRVLIRPAAFSVCEGARNILRFTPDAAIFHVAHEVAHLMDYKAGGTDAVHGPGWRGWYIAVVESMHGQDYAEALSQAFVNVGLDWTESNMPRRAIPLFSDPPPVRGGWKNPLTARSSESTVWS